MAYDFTQTRTWTVTRSTIAVGIVDGVFLASNANRVGLILTPANAARYTVSSAAGAVLDQGITIQAAGQTLLLVGPEVYPYVKLGLRAIASVAVSVDVIEIIRV